MSEHHAHGHDTTGVHGMLLFGADPVYLSHLPMFMLPHNFQVWLEVVVEPDVLEVLNADRHLRGDGLYTFVPEAFAITDLVARPPRTEIQGRVFRGHFERGGTPVTEPAPTAVTRVVRFAELDLAATHPARDLTYRVFGRSHRLYLAHEISGRPDLDQVLTARIVPGTATDQAGRPLDDGVLAMDFPTSVPLVLRGREDRASDRLVPGQLVTGLFSQSTGPGGEHGFRAEIEVGRELYAETGDLA